MQISVTMEPEELNTPIAFAEAIINSRMDWVRKYCDRASEEDIRREQNYLAEVAQHIQVYLEHNRV